MDNSDTNYKLKYLKYKSKYQNLKQQINQEGGMTFFKNAKNAMSNMFTKKQQPKEEKKSLELTEKQKVAIKIKEQVAKIIDQPCTYNDIITQLNEIQTVFKKESVNLASSLQMMILDPLKLTELIKSKKCELIVRIQYLIKVALNNALEIDRVNGHDNYDAFKQVITKLLPIVNMSLYAEKEKKLRELTSGQKTELANLTKK